MTENNTNRYFYKDDDGSLASGYKNKELRKGISRFTVRCPKELFEPMKEIFVGMEFVQKNMETDRDRTTEYSFDTIEYDNSKAKDVIAWHSVIYSKKEHEQEVKDKIKEISPDVSFRDQKFSSGITITTQLYKDTKAKRGLWDTIPDTFSNVVGEKMNAIPDPKYPVCVLTYARANESGRTHRTLTRMKVRHHLFVEQSQIYEYQQWYDPTYCEIIELPEDFRGWGTMGSTSVRNYILDWGLERGHERVWMLDDNIKKYIRLYQGVKNPIESPVVFTHIEDYIDRYDNVGAVSHNFNPFVREGDMRACVLKNGKQYSSMCLLTDKEFRFRYKHQEDNLMSIEMVERGFCNLCFNSVLYDKNTSGQDQGGNKKTIYKCEDGKTDGKGYKERFEYFKLIVQILHMEGKLTLKPSIELDDFVQRDLRHKAHDYHARVHYEYLENHSKNDIVKKENYDYICAEQKHNRRWVLRFT